MLHHHVLGREFDDLNVDEDVWGGGHWAPPPFAPEPSVECRNSQTDDVQVLHHRFRGGGREKICNWEV